MKTTHIRLSVSTIYEVLWRKFNEIWRNTTRITPYELGTSDYQLLDIKDNRWVYEQADPDDSLAASWVPSL